MKTERVSYDCMTPSAARGLLESIYWHPGLRWIIDRIHVCAPIHFTNIRRNEVKDIGIFPLLFKIKYRVIFPYLDFIVRPYVYKVKSFFIVNYKFRCTLCITERM